MERSLAKGPPRRAAAALVHGAMLLAVMLLFRFEKALAVGLAPGLFGWLGLLLPELGCALLAMGLWWLASRWVGRRPGLLWWLPFLLSLVLLYALTAVEHAFYLHTGIRLHYNLVAYTVANFSMVAGIAAFGVDTAFIMRTLLLVLMLLLASILARRASPLVAVLPRRSPWALVLVGALLLFWPAPDAVQHAGLQGSTWAELVRPLPTAAELAEQVPPESIPSQPIYSQPVLQGGAQQRPNIVLVILESTRQDVVPPWARESFHGRVPTLAKLAQESLAFDHAYATVTHTSKALVGILCGMYPRLEMAILEPSEGGLPLACLPRLLGELGYRTTFVQSAQGAFENRPGLVRNLGYQQAAFQETLRSEEFALTGYLGMDEMSMVQPAMAATREQPFFLTLLTVSPHHPYQVPAAPRPRSRRLEAQMVQYLLTIQHQDRFLGEVVAGLEAAGLSENTLLIVLGDHGEAFGEHLRMQHDLVPYDEVVKVPLLMWAPELLGEGRRVQGLRSQLDLLPTVLELIGAPWQGQLPGRSLLSSSGHDKVLSSCWFTNACLAMREGDQKWVYHYGQRSTQLFDLREDPLELRDLAPQLDSEELLRKEQEILAQKLWIHRFWAQHPVSQGRAMWWLDDRQPPAAEPTPP